MTGVIVLIISTPAGIIFCNYIYLLSVISVIIFSRLFKSIPVLRLLDSSLF